MNSQTLDHDSRWRIAVVNNNEYEYEDLDTETLYDILEELWVKQFNGFFVQRHYAPNGRLIVFFMDEFAYVAFEDYGSGKWHCTYNSVKRSQAGWDESVRLTPSRSQEYSFPAYSIVTKIYAWELIVNYINNSSIDSLYELDTNGYIIEK